jgi:hypothetical protein
MVQRGSGTAPIHRGTGEIAAGQTPDGCDRRRGATKTAIRIEGEGAQWYPIPFSGLPPNVSGIEQEFGRAL